MKRILAIALVLCLLFTGCRSNQPEQKANNPKTSASDTEDNQNQKEQKGTPIPTGAAESDKISLLKLDSEWSQKNLGKRLPVEYIPRDYIARVPEYRIEKDLSNVENIDQFSGFTKEQRKILAENGFLVLPTQSTKMHYVYDTNEYDGVSSFITSDTVLHLYHQFYDKSLIHIETEYLYDKLALLTKQMLEKSILLLEQLTDPDLKELQKKNIVYFLTARMLMLDTEEIGVELDSTLTELAKQEYILAKEAKEITKSPLIQRDLDYTMFTVRGHYTKSQELERFFRTMMWFGIFPSELSDQKGVMNKEHVLQALLVTYTTFAKASEVSDAQLWSEIYLPTAQYVGLSDDIDVFTMNNLRKAVYGENEDPNIYNDEEYSDKLREAVKALPEPRIQGKTIETSQVTGKQFRYMGQRYILDSDILQDLVEPIYRPLPSALDVMGILGSNVAEELQLKVYKPQDSWPKYIQNYTGWKDTVKGFSASDWSSNLYTGWLWTLQDALKEFEPNSGMPYFMTTKAWKYKTLNTALGSYAELKHDTVLYGKQAMAEMGGPQDFGDYHYVEPNVELYHKLYFLTESTVSYLEKQGMINQKLLEGASEYKELLQLLITCSIKELQNEPLTEAEYQCLLRYGGTMENISNRFLNGIMNDDYPNIELSDMLVSDVASSPGAYLSLGTGYFDDIYVVIPINGKLYLTRGSVYSSYEFVSNERLTDEKWWELQGITINRSEYGDYPVLGEPSEALPTQPDWVKAFKSDSNQVRTKTVEVDWDNLAE
jgi:hypothetical protein